MPLSFFGRDRAVGKEREREAMKEELTHNSAFHRFAKAFETYQKIMKGEISEDISKSAKMPDILNKNIIRQRFSGIGNAFEDCSQKKRGKLGRPRLSSRAACQIGNLYAECMGKCETGKFSEDWLAKEIVDSQVRKVFFDLFKPNIGEETILGYKLVNEAIGYKVYVRMGEGFEGENVLSVEMPPLAVETFGDAIPKIREGLELLADKIKNRTIGREVNLVDMRSWLLAPDFDAYLEKIFDKVPEREEIFEERGDYISSPALMALLFNRKSLCRYLLESTPEGKPVLPKVYKVTLTPKEFVALFSKGE